MEIELTTVCIMMDFVQFVGKNTSMWRVDHSLYNDGFMSVRTLQPVELTVTCILMDLRSVRTPERVDRVDHSLHNDGFWLVL